MSGASQTVTQTGATASGTYDVVALEPWRTQALALVPLVDPWLDAAPPHLDAESLTPLVYAHVANGHLVLSGRSDRVWPHLATAAQLARVRLRRSGHLPQDVEITVPAGSSLPFQAPTLDLAAEPVTLQGVVLASAFPHGPIADAGVQITGVGHDLVPVWPPLSVRHPTGTPVHVRSLSAPTPPTSTVDPVGVGARSLRLTSDAGIAVGDVLFSGEASVAVVAQKLGGGVLGLAAPLPVALTPASTVTARTPGATGATTTLTRGADVGDGLLSVAAPMSGPVIEIATPVPEFRCGTITSDPAGRWRLGGVRGVTGLNVTVSATGFVTDGPTPYRLSPVDPIVIETQLHT